MAVMRQATRVQIRRQVRKVVGVHPKMGVSFRLPLESYTGIRSPLIWTTPNLGCTQVVGTKLQENAHVRR